MQKIGHARVVAFGKQALQLQTVIAMAGDESLAGTCQMIGITWEPSSDFRPSFYIKAECHSFRVSNF